MLRIKSEPIYHHRDEALFEVPYRSLKSEIEYRVKAIERIEYLVVAAIVATYAWFSQRTVPSVMWWIPVALLPSRRRRRL